MSRRTVLALSGVTKRFGALTANDDVSLALGEGEVLALLGENGAGKTTLMNILFGHYTADAGEVSVFGKVLPPGRPRAAIEAGVGMVHQHFTLAPNLTVLENVMIGTERLDAIASDRRKGRARLVAIAARFGLAVEPEARVGDLSVGERQRVEILKALYRDARILILDEPTAVLTQVEAERLFGTLKGMAAEGLSVIFISHKLGEVMGAADRVVVLRGGRVVAERDTRFTNRAELAELMVGRRVARPVRERRAPGPPLLVADAVDVVEGGAKRLDGVSFTVRSGEILGVIGVSGNGQAALGRLVSGLAPPAVGRLTLAGADIGRTPPRALVEAGVGRIPEDRHAEGAVGEMTVWENAVLERVREPRFSRRGLVDRAAARAFAAALIERFDIRGATPDTRTRLLSGGNMQKLILGRNLAGSPRLVVANQPTRGLDEGAIAAVHAELLAARAAGAGVLLISEDLDEVTALADRVQAIVKGRLSPSVDTDAADARTIGLMMAGVWET
ncbi:ABC transporter ATP-binding protein [Oharaeibacter diazotrophicus]|uniref:Nucleoside ABC transporter ATP-binding protein n=2 Tax=Oharaeibacter diazotrophicus TaxID=1920512 RepID=A0A4R6R8N0_9HYPH|nr:ABC transporter ATP-binding protein [Oharaeibacter diazotrophicus]TDP82390.1 nucleoside ABC transporter ATP-binding protein [Oharaeibacter diazotrophicus]BBE72847.1 ribose import ATP-binding protein RbsA [Pleomorphomonas sp. SM30]GLS76886.1 ABC transporter ATP-binding protein [Oharaeibacter diazotrophicus]